MLITGNYVTTNANDKKELLPNIDQVNEEVFTPAKVLSDSGYYSEQNDQEYNLKRMFNLKKANAHGTTNPLDTVSPTAHNNGASLLGAAL